MKRRNRIGKEKVSKNLTAHGEITFKLLSGEIEERVPTVIPRTMLICVHLDALSLVESGMDTVECEVGADSIVGQPEMRNEDLDVENTVSNLIS